MCINLLFSFCRFSENPFTNVLLNLDGNLASVYRFLVYISLTRKSGDGKIAKVDCCLHSASVRYIKQYHLLNNEHFHVGSVLNRLSKQKIKENQIQNLGELH